jgi:FtsZ-interacting cell division protein ZipA
MNRENRTIIILAIVIIVGITILGLYNNQKKGIQTKVNNKQFFFR